jgi:hypothetical protein
VGGGQKVKKIVLRLFRLTEIEEVFRLTAKKLGTFLSISLGLQEKFPK